MCDVYVSTASMALVTSPSLAAAFASRYKGAHLIRSLTFWVFFKAVGLHIQASRHLPRHLEPILRRLVQEVEVGP